MVKKKKEDVGEWWESVKNNPFKNQRNAIELGGGVEGLVESWIYNGYNLPCWITVSSTVCLPGEEGRKKENRGTPLKVWF